MAGHSGNFSQEQVAFLSNSNVVKFLEARFQHAEAAACFVRPVSQGQMPQRQAVALVPRPPGSFKCNNQQIDSICLFYKGQFLFLSLRQARLLPCACCCLLFYVDSALLFSCHPQPLLSLSKSLMLMELSSNNKMLHSSPATPGGLLAFLCPTPNCGSTSPEQFIISFFFYSAIDMMAFTP